MTDSLFTAKDELALVLGDELAKDFLDHRKLLKKPMTPKAGALMAAKLRKMENPQAAVEKSILKGWTDVYADDTPQQQTRNTTSRPARGMDHFARAIADEENGNGGDGNGQVGAPSGYLYDDRGLPRLRLAGK